MLHTMESRSLEQFAPINIRRPSSDHQAIEVAQSNDNGYVEFVYPSPEHLARTLAWQFWGLMVFIVAHIFVVGYTDPLDSPELSIQVIVIGIQIGMVVIIMLAFFVLSSQTIFMRFGRYDLYVREYALLFTAFFVELVLFIAAKVYYYISLFNQNLPPVAILKLNSYFILWLVQRIFLLIFWALATYCGFQAFKDQLYNPKKLIR